MANEDFKRKLTAILSADVAGYSRLMAEDERATVKTIETYREVMSTLIKQHRGRVIDSPGDNLLAEFTSVVDAVQCAVSVQKEFQARNESLPENRRMVFRIGINLGDVIEEKDRIYGDGVNIAARLESLAEPGGICVSKTAFDQIETKLPLGYEYIGEKSVKNIPKPVGAYRVVMEPRVTAAEEIEKVKAVPSWRRKSVLAGCVALVLVVIAALIWNFYFRPPPIEPASEDRMAYPLPKKPSIAVLPFDNMSDDPAQENVVDGITESIITGLSRTPEMFVIARNSVFRYKGKPVEIRQVCEELGVRYVLEGSVQKTGDRLRINAQLIDALSGRHLWAQRYDRDLKDLFALQDEITMKVITELQVKLTDGEYARALAKNTTNLGAYLKCLQAIRIHRRLTKEDFLLSRKMFKEAVALDPNYPTPYIYLGFSYKTAVQRGWSKSREEDMARAEQLARKAIELDDSLGMPHRLLADIYAAKKQWDKSAREAERGFSIDPNPLTMYGLAVNLAMLGRHEEAIALIKKTFRLDPIPPAMYIYVLGMSYFFAQRYEEALVEYRLALDRKGEFSPKLIHEGLAATYAMLGQEEKARYHAAEMLRIDPRSSLERIRKRWGKFRRLQTDIDHIISALRKAGLPEHPPLPLPDKPSIAVLPFINMSGDPKQEYLGDGISEDIITALSKSWQLFVIARHSSFSYKGKQLKVQQIARELGVRYILEGSVRKSEDRVRITAQLIDGSKGQHLWSELYDRPLRDILALQDEITMKIVSALQVKLTEGEQAHMRGKNIKNLEVYLKIMEAKSLWNKGTKEAWIRLGQVAQEIIDMAPELPYGYRSLAWHHWMTMIDRRGTHRGKVAQVFELAQKALSMDDSDSHSLALLGGVYALMRKYDKAIATGEHAVELAPSGAFEHQFLSTTLYYAGRVDEAIVYRKQAIRLDPFPVHMSFANLGRCYNMKGKYEEALEEYKKALQLAPGSFGNNVGITITYSLLGREEEARAKAKKLLEMAPKFSVEGYRIFVTRRLKYPADAKPFIDALRKAGIPEKAPKHPKITKTGDK